MYRLIDLKQFQILFKLCDTEMVIQKKDIVKI